MAWYDLVSIPFLILINLTLPYGTFHSDTSLTFAADGLVTSHFFRGSVDSHFRKAIQQARTLVKHTLYHEWRLHLAVSLIEQLVYSCMQQNRPFIYVECGVGEGHTLLTAYFYFLGLLETEQSQLAKKFFEGSFLLVDTFNGVDPSLISTDDTFNYITSPYHGSTLEIIKDRFSVFKIFLLFPWLFHSHFII